MRERRAAADASGARLAAFLERLMPLLGAAHPRDLCRMLGVEFVGAVYNYVGGAPNAAARHVAVICDRIGVNVSRVMLGESRGVPRPWFVDPRHAALDFEDNGQRAEVMRAIQERMAAFGAEPEA